ncbi:MAG TPA: glutamate synthase subunit alpha, partial [Ktedonobacteraceae bacterium]
MTYSASSQHQTHYPLYDAQWEHDACGIGFLAQVDGTASHTLVQTALSALARLRHRGAQDADAKTFDGTGILTQIPRALLLDELGARHISLQHPADLAVGMIFLPSEEHAPSAASRSRQVIEQALDEHGLLHLGWRIPPLDYSVLGPQAQATTPSIVQVLIARPSTLPLEDYERTLYHTRRVIEESLLEVGIEDCYIVSLSHRTLIYKGLLVPDELARFYLDLADTRYTSSLAIFHQRYSTNTFPSWPLAQPMRMLAHNGEINTLRGNRRWMKAREGALTSSLWGDQIQDLIPVIPSDASDSAQLDNVLELLSHSGRDVLHSMQMLIPPAWEEDEDLPPEVRAWCAYHAGIVEPWDGPAALVFSDGRIVAAALDRNGLRPA